MKKENIKIASSVNKLKTTLQKKVGALMAHSRFAKETNQRNEKKIIHKCQIYFSIQISMLMELRVRRQRERCERKTSTN